MFPGPPFCRVRLAQYQDIGELAKAHAYFSSYTVIRTRCTGILVYIVLGIRAVQIVLVLSHNGADSKDTVLVMTYIDNPTPAISHSYTSAR